MSLAEASEFTCRPHVQFSAYTNRPSRLIWKHRVTGELFEVDDETISPLRERDHSIVLSRGGWIGTWWHGREFSEIPAWISDYSRVPISGVMYDEDQRSWFAVYKAHDECRLSLNYALASYAPKLSNPQARWIGDEKLDRILQEVAIDRNGTRRASVALTKG